MRLLVDTSVVRLITCLALTSTTQLSIWLQISYTYIKCRSKKSRIENLGNYLPFISSVPYFNQTQELFKYWIAWIFWIFPTLSLKGNVQNLLRKSSPYLWGYLGPGSRSHNEEVRCLQLEGCYTLPSWRQNANIQCFIGCFNFRTVLALKHISIVVL